MTNDPDLHTKSGTDNDSLFSTLFTDNFDMLYNYGLHIIQDEESVKDCIQELFFRIWKNKIDLSAIENPKAYLVKGLRYQIINLLELKNNSVKKTEVEESLFMDFSPEDYYIQDQQESLTRKKVLEAINKLSPKQKEILYLRFFEDLEYDEISRIMKIKIQSVKNNLQRAYSPLRHYLSRFSIFLAIF
jgi:RNA polymerase sigma factor (sigma-70 family)